MQYLSGRSRKPGYQVSGNVVWLTYPTADRECGCVDPIGSLQQSVTRLSGQISRCKELQADIAAAVDTRRYELYRRSVMIGAQASDRSLAAAQGLHLSCLLQFVHSVAAARCDDRAAECNPPAQRSRLAQSIRQLEGTVERSQRLSRDMLAQCRRDGQCRDDGKTST